MQLSSARRRLLADPFNRSSNVAQPARGLGKGGDGERGGLGSFDGVEEGCSGSKPAAEVSHGIEVPRDARASRGDRSILASTMLIGLIECARLATAAPLSEGVDFFSGQSRIHFIKATASILEASLRDVRSALSHFICHFGGHKGRTLYTSRY